jgi:hypothetical protein
MIMSLPLTRDEASRTNSALPLMTSAIQACSLGQQFLFLFFAVARTKRLRIRNTALRSGLRTELDRCSDGVCDYIPRSGTCQSTGSAAQIEEACSVFTLLIEVSRTCPPVLCPSEAGVRRRSKNLGFGVCLVICSSSCSAASAPPVKGSNHTEVLAKFDTQQAQCKRATVPS